MALWKNCKRQKFGRANFCIVATGARATVLAKNFPPRPSSREFYLRSSNRSISTVVFNLKFSVIVRLLRPAVRNSAVQLSNE